MKKILLLITLFSGVLLADLISLYRTQGLEAVEEKLEIELSKKTYWDNYLENKNVDFGYYESKEFVIITQKGAKEISLYKVNKENNDLILKDNVIVGEKQGDKFIEGDKKTPEGVYDLTNKLTKLDPFYGPLALVTNYPNTFDKTLNKKGHGIWIHGMPLNKDRENYTKGCIALDNPMLKELDSSIKYDKSVLLISDTEVKKASKKQISTILSDIYKWKLAWKKSDIESYLDFYSTSFKRHDGMSIEKFKTYKTRIFSKKEKKTIKFSNINISPYPNSLNKEMFKVVLDEDFKTKYYSFEGKKELYIELVDNKIEILAEG